MRKNYRKKKFNKKRKSTYKIFFLILVGMTVGFAAINTTLQLIGTLNISRTTWDIHFENPTKTGGVTATKEVALKENDNTTVEYQVKLTNPGDFYEFTVDAKNSGTIDGMITGISNKVYENNVEVTKPDYLDFTVTYADDKVIANNHLLAAGKSESYKVKVAYKQGLAADQLPDQEKTYNFRFTVTYMQADENATTTCGNTVSFADDSWETIACNVRKGNLSKYHVGDTKEVEIDGYGTHTVRIANTSTPEECSTEGFSQTACGFVVEFADIITTHRMNQYVSGDTSTGVNNKGGWEYSDMRAYLNSTTYAYESIDYSSTGLFSKLPSELKSVIIDTYAVSGYGKSDTANFTTTDKLYLLASKEVYDVTNIPYDTAQAETRQLDYYAQKNVRTNNNNRVETKKKYNNEELEWWLRSAHSNGTTIFWQVNAGYGNIQYGDINDEDGVSPAFRTG